MMNDFTLARINYEGFKPDDHLEIKPNSVILLPMQPPAASGLIDTSISQVRGTHCITYTVLHVGKRTREQDELTVHPGDVVVVRMMYVDPIHPNEKQVQTDTMHILSILHRAPGVTL